MPERFKLGDKVILFNNDGTRFDKKRVHTITELYGVPHEQEQWFRLDNYNRYWFNEHWVIGLKEIIGD